MAVKNPLTKAVERLHPSSITWLEKKGYVRRVEEFDGEKGVQITQEGYAWFSSLDKVKPTGGNDV